jgi:hypothetical protein
MTRESRNSGAGKPSPQNNKGHTSADAEQTPESLFDAPNPLQVPAINPPEPASGPDPFDPESLRLGADFTAAASVKKVILSVPVRKPDKTWFVRAHPDPAFRLQTGVIELKEERELYLVTPNLWADLVCEATFRPKLLVTAINRQGTLFLWEVNLPRQDGKVDAWTRSAAEAVCIAQSHWTRVQANMNLGAYDVAHAMGNLGEPTWPEMPFRQILRVAFRDRLIDNPNHEVLRRLRGEV